MTLFTTNQWVILILVFLLGLLVGGWMFAGNKWKRRYREEVLRREALERDYKERERERVTTTDVTSRVPPVTAATAPIAPVTTTTTTTKRVP